MSRTTLWSDEATGLRAVLVIDDDTLGPAAGGIRTRPYLSADDAVADARRLARAMTLKCAIAGLNAGGGKISRAIKMYGTNDFWELAASGWVAGLSD